MTPSIGVAVARERRTLHRPTPFPLDGWKEGCPSFHPSAVRISRTFFLVARGSWLPNHAFSSWPFCRYIYTLSTMECDQVVPIFGFLCSPACQGLLDLFCFFSFLPRERCPTRGGHRIILLGVFHPFRRSRRSTVAFFLISDLGPV